MANKVTVGYDTSSKKTNLTLAFVRNELREGRLPADPLSRSETAAQHQGCLKALIFMLREYDELMVNYRTLAARKIQEYDVKHV